jgi:carbon monoxide dehydrogenase subunit G
MKYLKYSLGIIAILTIIFLLIGFIKPEISYDCEIMVDKPLAESWNVTQDEEKMPEWLEGFQKVEQVSGTPGTVGAVSNVYFVSDGQEMTIKETIKNIKPDESIEMLFESDFMNMDYELKMASINGKTKISSSTNAKGNGIFSKSIMALMGNFLKTEEETNLSNLKKTIEANTKNYSAAEEASTEPTED